VSRVQAASAREESGLTGTSHGMLGIGHKRAVATGEPVYFRPSGRVAPKRAKGVECAEAMEARCGCITKIRLPGRRRDRTIMSQAPQGQ